MKMKKILGLVIVTVLCLSSSVTAFAAGLTKSEQEIINKLKAGIEVDGKVIDVPASYLNQAENEMAKNKTDITATEANAIIGNVDKAQAIMEKEGITSISELKTSDSANQIVSLAKSAATTAGYTVAYNAAKGVVSVKNPDGKTVFTTKNVINQTGFDLTNTVLAGSFLVTLLAACFVIASKKKLFVNAAEA